MTPDKDFAITIPLLECRKRLLNIVHYMIYVMFFKQSENVRQTSLLYMIGFVLEYEIKL